MQSGATKNVLAYERQDKRENTSMSRRGRDDAAVPDERRQQRTARAGRAITTTFPAGSYLYQYAARGRRTTGTAMSNFYYTVPSNQQVSDLVIPKGGYFALSWRSPEMPDVNPSAPAITILQNGQPTPTLTYNRKDGPDGDPAFNPYGLPDTNTTDYQYAYTVPRVTNGTNLSFLARADGSAENILMELDGGVDINSQMGLGPTSGDLRDHPPALSTDVFLGYEQTQFVQRTCEKFAARDISRDVVGSTGAETYQATIGTAGFTVSNGSGYNTNTGTATYAYHDPSATALDGQAGATSQFYPAPQNAAGSPVTVWLKTAYQNQVNVAYLYYTTDGATYPEGVGRLSCKRGNPPSCNWSPISSTVIATAATSPIGGRVLCPHCRAASCLRYKIGAYTTNAASAYSQAARMPWRSKRRWRHGSKLRTSTRQPFRLSSARQ